MNRALTPVIDSSVRAIVQPNCVFLYSYPLKRYDIFSDSTLIYLDMLDGRRSIEDIIASVSIMFPDAPPAMIVHDCLSLLSFLKERGYLSLADEPVPADGSFVEIADSCEQVKAVFADIEITRNCNLKCLYCYANATERMDELPAERWQEILSCMRNAGLRAVKISGGEPLVYHDIRELLPWIARNFITSINTNGWFIDMESANWLSKLSLQEIQVSLDSTDPAIHDKMRGVGSWQKAMEAIRHVCDVGIPLRISATIGAENRNSVEALRVLAERVNAELNFEIMKPVGRGEKLPQDTFSGSSCTGDEQKAGLLSYLEVRCQAQLGLIALSSDGVIKPCNLTKAFFKKRKADVFSEITDQFVYGNTNTFRHTDKKCKEVDMAALRANDVKKCVFS